MRCAELSKRLENATFQQNSLGAQVGEATSRAVTAESDLHSLQEHLRTKDAEIKVRAIIQFSISTYIILLLKLHNNNVIILII